MEVIRRFHRTNVPDIGGLFPEIELVEGVNTLMFKVWEGGGGHNVAVRFQDPLTFEAITEGLSVQLCPNPLGCGELPPGCQSSAGRHQTAMGRSTSQTRSRV